MASHVVSRCFFSARIRRVSERTISGLTVSSYTCGRTHTGDALDTRPPQTRRNTGSGRHGGAGGLGSFLKSVATAAVGLGLGFAALSDPGDDGARHVLRSARCAAPFKPDSPRYKYNFIADVVEKSTPAVVFIEIIGRQVGSHVIHSLH